MPIRGCPQCGDFPGLDMPDEICCLYTMKAFPSADGRTAGRV